jgi:putative hydrolase of the HAD superfamily
MTLAAADAFVFDLGNVLVEIDFHRVFAAWAEAVDLRAEEVERRFAFDDMHRAFEVGRVEPGEFFDHVRRVLDVALPDATLAAGWNAVFVDEMPGMRELVAALAGRAPLYVLSNTNVVHHDLWKARYAALLRPFEAIFVSHELGERKPDRAAFDAVLARIGIEPQRVVFFDDLPENVAAAARMGMRAFVVRSAADVRAAIDLGLELGRGR